MSQATQRGPQATRSGLIAAATELFAERGFDGTTVEAIAQRAGLNKALISYHFGGKHELYTAILESTFEQAREPFEAIRRSPEPSDVRLLRFIQAFVDIATARPAFPKMMLREAVSGGRHLEAKLARRIFEIFAPLREIVEEGVEEGTFRPVDPFLTHLTLVGTLIFFFATADFRERVLKRGRLPLQPPAADDFVRHVEALLTRGLAALQHDGPGRRSVRGPAGDERDARSRRPGGERR